MLIVMTMVFQAGMNAALTAAGRGQLLPNFTVLLVLFCFVHFFSVIMFRNSFAFFKLKKFSTFIQQPETSRTCKVMEMKFAQKFLFRIEFHFFKQKF